MVVEHAGSTAPRSPRSPSSSGGSGAGAARAESGCVAADTPSVRGGQRSAPPASDSGDRARPGAARRAAPTRQALARRAAPGRARRRCSTILTVTVVPEQAAGAARRPRHPGRAVVRALRERQARSPRSPRASWSGCGSGSRCPSERALRGARRCAAGRPGGGGPEPAHRRRGVGPGAARLAPRRSRADERRRDGPRWVYGSWDSGWWSPFDHREMRDDRVVFAATRLWPGSYTATYLARATTPGVFVRPPAHAEEMYNPAVYGESDGGEFTVRSGASGEARASAAAAQPSASLVCCSRVGAGVGRPGSRCAAARRACSRRPADARHRCEDRHGRVAPHDARGRRKPRRLGAARRTSTPT